MMSTLKPKAAVVAALKAANWDPVLAFEGLAEDMREPEPSKVYKYLIKRGAEKDGFKKIE
jgi:hypothetical protein